MNVNPTFVVTRQHYFYDDFYAVEISIGGIDYVSPDAYAAKYASEWEPTKDPREAAEIAIAIAESWRASLEKTGLADLLPVNCFSITGVASSLGVYPVADDIITADELKQWAQGFYERLPRCDLCNDIADSSYRDLNYEEYFACCSSHAEDIACSRAADYNELAEEEE